ncbi:MAG: ATP-dependent Clp protease adaptor ClpS [Desulfobacterales bacterium]
MSGFSPETKARLFQKPGKTYKNRRMYKVLLPDYTTMEFVVELLMHVFHKTFEDALGHAQCLKRNRRMRRLYL